MTTLFRRALLVGAVCLLPSVASAQETPPPPEEPVDPIFEIVFPVAGPNHYTDTWGAARGSGRTHEGTDIMADKGIPVVAAADGVVGWISSQCCGLELVHAGFETWYIHLNNDTAGTDDGLGWGIAEGVVPGAPVSAGQLIGWVGDSGNAEEAGSHLHFEIRVNGVALNSYASLLAADPAPDDPQAAWTGFFADDDDSVHEESIDALAAVGVTKGCNPPDNTNYCPDESLTRGQIAAFIRRNLALAPSVEDFYTDDTGHVFEDDINAVTTAGIGFGCTATTYCSGEPLLREEMAEMLVRAFASADPDRYANTTGVDYFIDDQLSPYQASINRLRAADVTRGCNPPANSDFCPDRPLSRAEMATFFDRALGD